MGGGRQRARDQVGRRVAGDVRRIHAYEPTANVRLDPVSDVDVAVLALPQCQRVRRRAAIDDVVQFGERVAQVPQLLLVVAAEDAVAGERELGALVCQSGMTAGVEELPHAPPCLRTVAVPPHLVRESAWRARHVRLSAARRVRLSARVVDRRRRIVSAAMVIARAAVGAVRAEILAAPPAASRHADD